MTVNVNLIVVCGFTGCPWSMEVDRSSGADPMVVHEAYLAHLDEHDPDGAECEAAEHWVGVTRALMDECSSCHAEPGQPHTEYCKLSKWAEHDAEVARCLAEDKTPGGVYAGQVVHRTPDSVHRLEPGCCDYNATFICPKCEAVSYHPEDVRQGYCGRCHDFTGLYAGDNPSKIAAEQARVDRFMAGED